MPAKPFYSLDIFLSSFQRKRQESKMNNPELNTKKSRIENCYTVFLTETAGSVRSHYLPDPWPLWEPPSPCSEASFVATEINQNKGFTIKLRLETSSY